MQAPPILVTGGTGTLGQHVVAGLRKAGRSMRILSRHPRAASDGVEHVTGDLAAGAGIERALDGVETIVHCAGDARGDEDMTRNLARAAAGSSVSHLVYISVVGADRVPQDGALDRMMFGYFGSKHRAERLVGEAGVPWTTLRATQFHDLLFSMAQQMAKLPVIPIPRGFRFQPIEAAEVADRLVELALAAPAGRVADMAGPRAYGMDELVQSYLRATGKLRAILRIPLPGNAARAYRDGANLAPDRAVGRRTWEDFLAARVGAV